MTNDEWADRGATPFVIRHSSFIAGALLFAAIVIAYLPAFRAGFIWDDDKYVTQYELITAPDGLRRIWFWRDSPSQYFPLTSTTFRLEHALWGMNPAGYHAVNVLLHAVNALLLWRVLLRVMGARTATSARIPGREPLADMAVRAPIAWLAA